MNKRFLILFFAAVLMLSACSSAAQPGQPVTRSGETLPNKPVPASTAAPRESLPAKTTQAQESTPQTEPESTAQPESSGAAAPESETAAEPESRETDAPPETKPGETPFVTPDFYTGKTYRVSKYWFPTEDDEAYYTMDEAGHLLDMDKVPTPIEDVLTGEVAFYTRTVYTKIGSNYDDVKVSAVLYDREGNILEEDVPRLFTAACGSCVVRLDSRAALMWEGQFSDYSGDLYDPYAHRVMREDVCSVERLTESIALAEDREGRLLGTVDGSGNVVSGFPTETGPYRWPYSCGNGFVIADTEDEADGGTARVVLDRDLKYVDYAAEGEQYSVLNGGTKGFILAKTLEDGTTYLFDMEKWEVLLNLEAEVKAMDSRSIICEENEWNWICDWNGNRLTESYPSLYPVREDETQDFQGFIAVYGDELQRLDRDGKVVSKVNVPNLYYANVYDGAIFCEATAYDDTGESYFESSVYDFDLREIVPAGYSNIRKAAPGVFACSTETPQGELRATLINDRGEIIMKNLFSVGEGDEDAIPVVKGFTVGLIDRQGNWIAKNSRYDQEPGD